MKAVPRSKFSANTVYYEFQKHLKFNMWENYTGNSTRRDCRTILISNSGRQVTKLVDVRGGESNKGKKALGDDNIAAELARNWDARCGETDLMNKIYLTGERLWDFLVVTMISRRNRR